jgi:hypothetical protein
LIGTTQTFEICIMNADGTGAVQQLTVNAVFDVRPMWSPDSTHLLLGRPAKPVGAPGAPAQQLFVMAVNQDGTCAVKLLPDGNCPAQQLTNANPGIPPVVTAGASWGVLRVKAP